jgi:2'-5' RNA ligase
MPENVRLFIAIQLDEQLKAMLNEISQELEARIPAQTVRWVRPAAMHLTLVFLGETPARQLDPIKEAIRTAAARVSETSFTAVGLGCFPNLRRPRVVWVGVEEPSGLLSQLKRALDHELEPLGFKPETRPFSPHLTLGRVNKRASRPDAAELGRVIENTTLQALGRVKVTNVHLIRSDLQRSGPIYTVLASFPLHQEPQNP